MTLRWTLELHVPEMAPTTVAELALGGDGSEITATTGGFAVSIRTEKGGNGSLAVTAAAAPQTGEAACYWALRCRGTGELFAFSGPCPERVVMRQSPHDPDRHDLDAMRKQPVPMGAIRHDNAFHFAVSDHPAAYGNLTTQVFAPSEGYFLLTSGDSGECRPDEGLEFPPAAHPATPGSPHVFTALIGRSDARTIIELRQDVFAAVAAQWGGIVGSPGHAMAFAANYMHLRCNETGYSRRWIVPGIEYANKQYTRDAFWQSMILPLEMEQECYDAVYPARYRYAENGILFLIWSARLRRRGGTPDLRRARDALSFVAENIRGDCYYAPQSGKGVHTKMFRSWYDICDFEDDDVITYNQSLLAAALRAAQELGLPSALSADGAADAYRALFSRKLNFFPLSRDRQVLCVDALVGELLAIVWFDHRMLPQEMVAAHFAALNRIARTEFGYKVTCAADGAYLPPEFYCTSGEIIAPYFPERRGAYSWGGAYFLYDMLATLAAVAHGVPGAEELAVWRTGIEIKLGGTYHENLNTVTGEPGKPNQGWNAAILALWPMMMDKGLARTDYPVEVDHLIHAQRSGA